MFTKTQSLLQSAVLMLALLGLVFSVRVYADDQPDYLKDRGTGMVASQFGTYINAKELVIYPFYEYYRNGNYEYNPKELGYNKDATYKGKFKSSQELLYIGYGLNDSILLELEGALATQSELTKSDSDTSNMPSKLKESGQSDMQCEIRWRCIKETATRPEIYTYLENAFVVSHSKPLIGNSGEIVVGAGAVKGFSFGTMTLRADLAYDRDDKTTTFGEYAVEYLRKLSEKVRIETAVEGESNSLTLLAEMQYSIKKNMVFKINVGLGLTSTTDDFTPEIGLMFYF